MLHARIGRRIAAFRRERNISIKTFSEWSGISTALVSELERGIGNPSLSVLQRLAATLEVPLASLFAEEIDNAALICRKADRVRLHHPNETEAAYDNLTPGPLQSNVELLLLTLVPHGETNHEFSRHFEEEIAYVVDGEAWMVFEQEEFPLSAGDSIRILPSRRHKLRNETDRPVKVLFIKSKPAW
ncbi:cupin domain-containing protein [Victivallis sp. Marseille-Q1083]|uniref:helix-turn-helix domain-containing protein n=1 Tax=Victivallis sp. Marseille-Q1083 TaxID=2717288 RepID=UPI00158ED397|nr:cupin domain-containing protein [Victivallis sp. Marseille-Q1083]